MGGRARVSCLTSKVSDMRALCREVLDIPGMVAVVQPGIYVMVSRSVGLVQVGTYLGSYYS